YVSRPSRNASLTTGRRSSSCATRTFSLAVDLPIPHRSTSHATHEVCPSISNVALLSNSTSVTSHWASHASRNARPSINSCPCTDADEDTFEPHKLLVEVRRHPSLRLRYAANSTGGV